MQTTYMRVEACASSAQLLEPAVLRPSSTQASIKSRAAGRTCGVAELTLTFLFSLANLAHSRPAPLRATNPCGAYVCWAREQAPVHVDKQTRLELLMMWERA